MIDKYNISNLGKLKRYLCFIYDYWAQILEIMPKTFFYNFCHKYDLLVNHEIRYSFRSLFKCIYHIRTTIPII